MSTTLPLTKTALDAAASCRIPAIADLHENFAASLQVWETGDGALQRLLFNRCNRWHAHESKVLRQVPRAIVVDEIARERLIRDGAANDKVTVVTNAEPPEFARVVRGGPAYFEDMARALKSVYRAGVA